MVKTRMFRNYMVKFGIRITIFVLVLLAYLWNKPLLQQVMTQPIRLGVNALHLLWLVFMLMMLRHLFPTEKLTMALLKQEPKSYVPVPDYSEIKLLRFVQDMNLKSWKVMLIWLSFNSVFGLLYLFGLLDEADLLMITVFYFLCDYICILIFCPFQSFIMKNKCCVNCRIYDWGHFMMFTPMLFIRNFFSWSLFFTALIVLLHWEIAYAKHPERFWAGSNQTLQCRNCKDKTCRIKRGIQKHGTVRVPMDDTALH